MTEDIRPRNLVVQGVEAAVRLSLAFRLRQMSAEPLGAL